MFACSLNKRLHDGSFDLSGVSRDLFDSSPELFSVLRAAQKGPPHASLAGGPLQYDKRGVHIK